MNSAIRTLGLVVALLGGMPAYGGKPVFGDTVTFGIGGMSGRADSTFRDTRDGRRPVDLDMNDLGMDEKASSIWGGVSWQFADSWGFSVSYSGFDSDGQVSASEAGNFGDIEWGVNASLDSDLSLDLYIADVHWDFLNTERTHVGVGVGLHIADLEANIGATISADINGTPLDPPIDLGSETAALTAPLPNVSLRAGHRFGDSWYLGGTFGYFELSVDNIEGELISLRGSLEWRPGGGAFGAGLGYQYVDVYVKDSGGDRTKEYDIDFYGPVLFVQLGF